MLLLLYTLRLHALMFDQLMVIINPHPFGHKSFEHFNMYDLPLINNS
jgi:hypothetical protein